MAKEKEKKLAQSYYIDHNMTAKEIAKKLHVTEKTLSDWVVEGNWKKLRIAKQTQTDKIISQYNELLEQLIDKRLAIERKEIDADPKGVIDEISKVSAAIDRARMDGQLSLRTHIKCIEKFMNNLSANNSKLYMELLDYQIDYVKLLAEELN